MRDYQSLRPDVAMSGIRKNPTAPTPESQRLPRATYAPKFDLAKLDATNSKDKHKITFDLFAD